MLFLENLGYKEDIMNSEETKLKISQSHKGRFKNSYKYGGHRKKRKDGYIKVYVPDHPLATKDGYVMEHILVMEEAIGRYITRDEVVHHKNKIRDDNRLENLELMTFEEHSRLHTKERWGTAPRPARGSRRAAAAPCRSSR